MRYQLATSGILAAWETGAARQPLDRALAILWAAGATQDCDPADLPLAERDARLLAIRANSFGAVMPARAVCPECDAEMEMDLNADDLAGALAQGEWKDTDLRPLTSRDLAAVAELDGDAVTDVLRHRLGIDDPSIENVDQRIEDLAAAAELSTQITCAECDTDWTETLDVAAHIWADITTATHRLLSEVTQLAAAFGWSEADILSLSSARRAVYLARVQS